ncbi:hypothetical protein J6590_036629 [Homalodisca vitripennis]|nr:hypothetical protein J6590_036629 [Homalodisca vitripennis]
MPPSFFPSRVAKKKAKHNDNFGIPKNNKVVSTMVPIAAAAVAVAVGGALVGVHRWQIMAPSPHYTHTEGFLSTQKPDIGREATRSAVSPLLPNPRQFDPSFGPDNRI